MQKVKNLQLAKSQFDILAPVELFLGADVFWQVWENQGVHLGDGCPTTYSSKFRLGPDRPRSLRVGCKHPSYVDIQHTILRIPDEMIFEYQRTGNCSASVHRRRPVRDPIPIGNVP